MTFTQHLAEVKLVELRLPVRNEPALSSGCGAPVGHILLRVPSSEEVQSALTALVAFIDNGELTSTMAVGDATTSVTSQTPAKRLNWWRGERLGQQER